MSSLSKTRISINPIVLGLLFSAFLFFGCKQNGSVQTPIGLNGHIAPPIQITLPKEHEDGKKLFFWKAEDKDKNKVIYFLGSVHVGKKSFYPMDATIETAFKDTDLLVVETFIEQESPQMLAAAISKMAMLPKDTQLPHVVSNDTWQKTEAFLKKHMVPIETVTKQKPWFASTTILSLRLQDIGYDYALGIDAYFIGKKEKPTVAIETMAFHMSLFDSLSLELQELLLIDAIAGNIQLGGDMDEMIALWQTGNAEKLNSMLMHTQAKMPRFLPFFKKLLTDRNHTMAESIQDLLKKENKLFVVVGAAHLVGKEGLIEIFKQKQFKVKQLSQASTVVPSAQSESL